VPHSRAEGLALAWAFRQSRTAVALAAATLCWWPAAASGQEPVCLHAEAEGDYPAVVGWYDFANDGAPDLVYRVDDSILVKATCQSEPWTLQVVPGLVSADLSVTQSGAGSLALLAQPEELGAWALREYQIDPGKREARLQYEEEYEGSSRVRRIGDLDGDGTSDLYFYGRTIRMSRSGTWVPLPERPLDLSSDFNLTEPLPVGDVTGDGHDDVLLSYRDVLPGGSYGVLRGPILLYEGGPDGLLPDALWTLRADELGIELPAGGAILGGTALGIPETDTLILTLSDGKQGVTSLFGVAVLNSASSSTPTLIQSEMFPTPISLTSWNRPEMGIYRENDGALMVAVTHDFGLLLTEWDAASGRILPEWTTWSMGYVSLPTAGVYLPATLTGDIPESNQYGIAVWGWPQIEPAEVDTGQPRASPPAPVLSCRGGCAAASQARPGGWGLSLFLVALGIRRRSAGRNASPAALPSTCSPTPTSANGGTPMPQPTRWSRPALLLVLLCAAMSAACSGSADSRDEPDPTAPATEPPPADPTVSMTCPAVECASGGTISIALEAIGTCYGCTGGAFPEGLPPTLQGCIDNAGLAGCPEASDGACVLTLPMPVWAECTSSCTCRPEEIAGATCESCCNCVATIDFTSQFPDFAAELVCLAPTPTSVFGCPEPACVWAPSEPGDCDAA